MGSFLKKLCVNRAEVNSALVKASEANTYVETVAPSLADSLHLTIRKNYPETLSYEFSRFAKSFLRKLHLGAVEVIADVTTEDFYGKSSNLYIHGWTGEKGVQGKFHFLVLALRWRNKTLPFFAEMLPLGAFIAERLGKALRFLQSFGVKVKHILLDRGFYSGDIIQTMKMEKVKYLIFVPRYKSYRYMLESVESHAVVEHEIRFCKAKSKYSVKTNLALLKNSSGYDWIFASDLFLEDASTYVSLYKKRWIIETMFRVHDEARIKSKSLKAEIRMFYFVVSLLLLFVWTLFVKGSMPFKRFVIEITKLCASEQKNFYS